LAGRAFLVTVLAVSTIHPFLERHLSVKSGVQASLSWMLACFSGRAEN
jgi:hypothetical protein